MTTIRRAVPADAEELTHLHLDCWDEAYAGLVTRDVLESRRDDVGQRVANWRRTLDGGASVHLAVADEQLIGLVCAAEPRDPDPGLPPLELRVLYVRKAWWGTPTGYDLMRTQIADRPAYLRVLANNQRAIRFYARNGFVDDGTRVDDPDGPLMRMVRW
jgi:GNAT superfamily N-acetyltransferase